MSVVPWKARYILKVRLLLFLITKLSLCFLSVSYFQIFVYKKNDFFIVFCINIWKQETNWKQINSFVIKNENRVFSQSKRAVRK